MDTSLFSLFRFRSQNTRCRILLLASTAICVVFLLLSCAVDNDDDDDNDDGGTPPDEQSFFQLTAVSNDRGQASVSFNVAKNSTKFSIEAASKDNMYVSFSKITNDRGVNYLDPNGQEISLAKEGFRGINAASVPSRSSDPKLDDSSMFQVTANVLTSAFGSAAAGEVVTFTIHSKGDTDLNNGRLKVNVYYVGDVGQDKISKDVTAVGLNLFRDIYSGQGGITLDIREFDIDGPVLLPVPKEGSPFYKTATSSTGSSPAVHIFIGGDIEELGASGEVLGLSGGIIGPPHPSARSAVAISVFAGAGSDGVFDAEDIRLYGETIAHETGHFLGLFHPVDFSGSSVTATDPLDDTVSCRFVTECLASDDLTKNLMFPNPVPSGNGGYIPQNQLTAEQRGVLNRYIAVD